MSVNTLTSGNYLGSSTIPAFLTSDTKTSSRNVRRKMTDVDKMSASILMKYGKIKIHRIGWAKLPQHFGCQARPHRVYLDDR